MAAWPFVHPGLAAAAVASAVIPLVIHLINRRRFKRVRWAAMGFLLAANNRSLRRIRLEQWLLLAIRCAVIGLLGLTLARPYLADSTLVGLGATARHRILLIDNSLSACAEYDETGNDTGRPAAVTTALQLVSRFPRPDAISVITLADPADAVIADAEFDRRMARERISAIKPTQRRTDLAGALTAAKKIIADSPAAPQNQIVYLIGDQAATAWRASVSADDSDAGPVVTAARSIAAQANLVIVPTTTQDRPNLAVTGLMCSERLPMANHPARLTAVVNNFGRSPATGAALQVLRRGEIIRRIPLQPIGPGQRVETSFSIALGAARQQGIDVRLQTDQPDALPTDDTRHISLEVFEALGVLLVDGRPGADRFSGESGYLATALAPTTARQRSPEAGLLVPKTVTELELPGEVLSAFQLVALCNVQRLEQEMWERLEEFVSDGGGLLIFAGDQLNRDNYNRLGYADGKGLLPARLGNAIGDPANRDTFVRLTPGEFTHPAMVDFSETDQSSLFLKGRVFRLLSCEPDPKAAVLLRYENGLPAILERSFGSGKVCLVTTTANMAWNNLAARGDYVSLVWSLVSYLAPDSTSSRNLAVGGTIRAPLTAAETALSLQLTTPGGEKAEASLEPGGTGYKLRFGPLEEAGIYRTELGRRLLCFAANTDPVESDLRILDESALRELIDAPFAYIDRTDGLAAADRIAGSAEAAGLLQYVVLFLLAGEAWMAMRFAQRN